MGGLGEIGFWNSRMNESGVSAEVHAWRLRLVSILQCQLDYVGSTSVNWLHFIQAAEA